MRRERPMWPEEETRQAHVPSQCQGRKRSVTRQLCWPPVVWCRAQGKVPETKALVARMEKNNIHIPRYLQLTVAHAKERRDNEEKMES